MRANSVQKDLSTKKSMMRSPTSNGLLSKSNIFADIFSSRKSVMDQVIITDQDRSSVRTNELRYNQRSPMISEELQELASDYDPNFQREIPDNDSSRIGVRSWVNGSWIQGSGNYGVKFQVEGLSNYDSPLSHQF